MHHHTWTILLIQYIRSISITQFQRSAPLVQYLKKQLSLAKTSIPHLLPHFYILSTRIEVLNMANHLMNARYDSQHKDFHQELKYDLIIHINIFIKNSNILIIHPHDAHQTHKAYHHMFRTNNREFIHEIWLKEIIKQFSWSQNSLASISSQEIQSCLGHIHASNSSQTPISILSIHRSYFFSYDMIPEVIWVANR